MLCNVVNKEFFQNLQCNELDFWLDLSKVHAVLMEFCLIAECHSGTLCTVLQTFVALVTQVGCNGNISVPFIFSVENSLLPIWASFYNRGRAVIIVIKCTGMK